MISDRLLLISLFIPTATLAQDDSHRLDSVAVVGHMPTSRLRGTSPGTLTWSMQGIQEMPQMMGNADPLHCLQVLPGVQTNAEHDAGMHIQGCDNGHNCVSIEGIPVYNPSHLLGLFSVFNPTHFSDLQLTKSAHSAADANRLGGFVDVYSAYPADSVYGTLTMGLISTQGTVRLPVGHNNVLTGSFRSSYLNLLYGPWLKMDETQLRYDFSDYNLSWDCMLSDRDRLTFTTYIGHDKTTADDGSSIHLNWGNQIFGLRWKHLLDDGGYGNAPALEQCLYYTHYGNNLDMHEAGRNIKLPASVQDVGYRATVNLHHLSWGTECVYHDICPQYPKVSSADEASTLSSVPLISRNLELSLFSDYKLSLFNQWTVCLGLRGSALLSLDNERNFYSVDPLLSIAYRANYGGIWGLTCAKKTQYVQQTGFSQIGFPVEFWYSADDRIRPQYSHGISLSHIVALWDDSWLLNTEIYGKRLCHQKEYTGNLMSFFFDDHYCLYDQLEEGNGVNYGLNLLLNKRYGRGTLSFSYSLGRALRRFNDDSHTFPASHERIHELNAVSSYQLSRRWRIGGTFVLASGTPFTAPLQFYLLNDRLISQFERYNASRLPLYHRLDLSVSYYLKSSRFFDQSLNFSLYNAYAHKNCVTYRMKISADGRFGLRKVCMIRFPLPSISYSLNLR